MSQLKEDTMQIAEILAEDKYEMPYSKLTKEVQDKLWKMAQGFKQTEINILADNRQKGN